MEELMNTQTDVSQSNYSLGDRIGGIFAGTIMTGLLVGGPASIGGLIGGAIGFGADAAEVVVHLNQYSTIPEAVASANTWTAAASLATGTIGAIIGAAKALEHPWARGSVCMMLGMKPTGI